MSDFAECMKSVGCATRDLSIVPLFTFGFVEETINALNKSEGCKEVSKGYKYFSEKYISDIRDYDPLVERQRTSISVVTASMRRGIPCEPTATEAFIARMNDNVNIYPCRICVSPWSPWLAASPDRKVHCPSLTPCYGLLDIKCPVKPLSQCVTSTRMKMCLN